MNAITNYCFIILNYNTFQYTVNCIESIFNKCKNNYDYKIIIVDNKSPDNSGVQLKQYYEKNNTVDVILNADNLGFAKGNNIGISYAKQKYNPKFIIVNNSDTLLLTEDFLNIIEKIYQEYKFSLLGPKICIKDEKVQYIPQTIQTLQQMRHTILYYYTRYLLNLLHLERLDSKFFTKHYIDKDSINVNKIYKNVVLHGSFFILSIDYFKYYTGIPEDSNFYREEDFLYMNCKKKNLLTLYYPQLEIYHNINGATINSYANLRKRNLFKLKKFLKANRMFYKKLKLEDMYDKNSKKNS